MAAISKVRGTGHRKQICNVRVEDIVVVVTL